MVDIHKLYAILGVGSCRRFRGVVRFLCRVENHHLSMAPVLRALGFLFLRTFSPLPACQPRVLGDDGEGQAPKKSARLWAAIFRHTWARIERKELS